MSGGGVRVAVVETRWPEGNGWKARNEESKSKGVQKQNQGINKVLSFNW